MIVSRFVIAFIAIAIVAGTGCGAAGPAAGSYSTISAQELQAQTNAGEKLVIVDLREPELYRAGHIQGAINIPFEQFRDRMAELSPDAGIALVCHTGPMGDISGRLLAERGYTKVSNLKGGMAAWSGKLAR